MGRIPRKIEGNGSPIQHLWEVHKEIARLQVAGMRPFEICKRLGYTAAWLSTIQNSPVYREYLAKLSGEANKDAVDIKKRISEGAETGVVELLKILKGEGEYQAAIPASLKVKVAQDFLDRDGHGKVQKIQQEGTMVILNADRIAALKEQRAKLLQNLNDPAQLPEQCQTAPSLASSVSIVDVEVVNK